MGPACGFRAVRILYYRPGVRPDCRGGSAWWSVGLIGIPSQPDRGVPGASGGPGFESPPRHGSRFQKANGESFRDVSDASEGAVVRVAAGGRHRTRDLRKVLRDDFRRETLLSGFVHVECPVADPAHPDLLVPDEKEFPTDDGATHGNARRGRRSRWVLSTFIVSHSFVLLRSRACGYTGTQGNLIPI